MRMLMENMCSDSPMFDFVEQAAGKEVRNPISTIPASAAAESHEASASAINEGGPTKAELVAQFAAQFEGDFGDIEFDDLNENVPISNLARMQLTVQDVSWLYQSQSRLSLSWLTHFISSCLQSTMVKQSLEILDDIRVASEDVQELRSDFITEIYETCSYIQKKSQKVIEAKLTAMDGQMPGSASND